MKIKYDVSIFLITDDNQYILSNEYDETEDNVYMFVCLTNDNLNSDFGDNNSICIYKDWNDITKQVKEELIQKNSSIPFDNDTDYVSTIWQMTEMTLNGTDILEYTHRNIDGGYLIHDFEAMSSCNGYKQTNDIINSAEKLLKDMNMSFDDAGLFNPLYSKRTIPYTLEEYIPAPMIAYNTGVTHNGKMYNGYLPSLGQLVYISRNLRWFEDYLGIGSKFPRCLGIVSHIELGGYWWSSSQCNNADVWCLSYAGKRTFYKVERKNCILPLFMLK